MKISIVYFSGTGNTEYIAKAYDVALKRLGHQVQLLAIDKIGQLEAHDLLIVGGPIYAGNMPDELINWVRKKVLKSTGNKGIVYSTSAGLQNANGVKSIGTKLIKKGYTLIDMPTFEMPRNFYVDKYLPTPISTQLIQLKTASEQVQASVEKLHVADSLSVKESVLSIDLFADLFRIMAKSMGKNFSMDESCIGCGKCERECPKQNIRYKDKKYLHQCMMCTRCIHGCPVNAISYKGKKIEQYKVLDV
jgi:ferredoxin